MKIYCDMEFTGLRKNTEIISIGIVADDGKKFYAELNDYSFDNMDERDVSWLKQNVLPYLIFKDEDKSFMTGSYKTDLMYIETHMEYIVKSNKAEVKELLYKWLNQYDEIIFVGDVLAYDWILFRDILIDNTPKNFPKYISYSPVDIATMMYILEFDPINTTRHKFIDTSDLNQGKIWQKQHNALYDAIVIKRVYDKLINMVHVLKKSTDILDLILYKRESSDKSNHIIIPDEDMDAINKLVLLKNKIKKGDVSNDE